MVDHHRYHLVDWNLCCSPLAMRGLGIKKICGHNKALLAKWLWMFGMKRESVEESYGC